MANVTTQATTRKENEELVTRDIPPTCENEVLAGHGGPATVCGKPATHTVAYSSTKWHGGLDEYYMCTDCLGYVRGCDRETGAEKLPLPGRIPHMRRRGVPLDNGS